MKIEEKVGDSLEDHFLMFFDDESDQLFHLKNDDEFQDPEERIRYWQSQESLLQEILESHGLRDSELQEDVKQVIEKARETNFCHCSKNCQVVSCLSCLRPRVVKLLSNKGFDATLRTSKWKHTSKFPGGTHEYIEVITSTPGKNKHTPFLIELQFRDEFKMAKACNEYCRLISHLPEIYIGKSDYLNAILGIVCDAATRSTKEKKIHIGPWRTRNFMQMKWSSSYQNKPRAFNVKLPSSLSPRQAHAPVMVRSSSHFSVAGNVVVVT